MILDPIKLTVRAKHHPIRGLSACWDRGSGHQQLGKLEEVEYRAGLGFLSVVCCLSALIISRDNETILI